MSGARRLIVIEALDFLRTLRSREQSDLLKRCREIAAFPSNYSDFVEHDAAGRRVEVHVSGKFAIKFWHDFADRHLKILDLHFADRSRQSVRIYCILRVCQSKSTRKCSGRGGNRRHGNGHQLWPTKIFL